MHISSTWILLAIVAILAFASTFADAADAASVASAKEASASDSVVTEKKTEGSAEVVATKPPPSLRIRTIIQACRKEFLRLCADRKDAVKCLAENTDKVEDSTCKTWLEARESCLGAVKKNKDCDEKESPRACLRRLNRSVLPELCSESDFYRSMKMFSQASRKAGRKSFPKST